MELTLNHDKKHQQFFAIQEEKKSVLDYAILPDGKTLDYRSTFVPPELRGKQIGANLVKYALDYAKENNFKIIPSCPFVKQIIDQHPEYQTLVAG